MFKQLMVSGLIAAAIVCSLIYVPVFAGTSGGMDGSSGYGYGYGYGKYGNGYHQNEKLTWKQRLKNRLFKNL